MISNLKKFLGNPAFLSTGLIFSINSILFSFWVTRLPYVKDKLQLSEGELGLVLFFLPLGAIAAMSVISRYIQKWGAGRVTIVTSAFFCVTMIVPVSAVSVWMLAMGLFMGGMASGAMDIAMNAVAASLEKQYKTVIMSTCHGFFSLGGMVGAFIGTAMIGLKIHPLYQMITAAVVLLAVLWLYLKPHLWLTGQEDGGTGPAFVMPTKPLLGLALIGVCIMLGEGAIADWSAVYIEELTYKGAYLAGLGYAGFSMSMTIGRFWGDSIIARLGALKIVRAGSILAIAGGLLVIVGIPWITIGGFMLMGLGYSCIVPVVFSASSQVKGVSPSQGIAAVATAGFSGFLIGPVLIGFIAESLSLGAGFIFLIVLAMISLFYAPRAFSLK
ncbi:MAG: MFS transporter [Bacteroidia bacterium]|nr:MFS transporter [Bacteroidia bacterium]